jgi:hypothetical protein
MFEELALSYEQLAHDEEWLRGNCADGGPQRVVCAYLAKAVLTSLFLLNSTAARVDSIVGIFR